MNDTKNFIQEFLFKERDEKYKAFQCKLMPTVDPDTVIGVRIPVLRKFAKEISQTPHCAAFLCVLPHAYYEENNLHAFLIESIKDYDTAISAVNAFLPYVDNWATCDSMTPKIFRKNLTRLQSEIDKWLQSKHTYTIRFGVGMLMKFFLDENFDEEYPKRISSIKSEEYYVNMMIAWYFATALSKQYNAVIPYLEQYRLAPWIHNKTIQKAIESYRIDDTTKAYLRTLK